MNQLRNEEGLTLVELLASIVILGLILLTFMSLFTNSFHYNRISSNNIEATNLAREVQEEFKVNKDRNLELKDLLTQAKVSTRPATFSKSAFPKLNLNQDIKLSSSGILELNINHPTYKVIVLIDLNQDPDLSSSLYKLQVQVFNQSKLLSKTFTYFES